MNLDKELLDYVKDFSSPQSELLKRIERKTNLYSVQPRMLSGHIQGGMLNMITSMINPKRVVEIGTFTGYSAICIASGMNPNSEFHTIDINDELSHIAEEFINESGLTNISMHIGSALDIIPKLGGKFDLVFIDGDKREYPQYLDMLLDGGYVDKGSFLIADNILWDGKVVDNTPKNLKDKYTQGILKFNKMVVDNPRLEVVIMPFRDGMSLIKVI